MPLTYNETLFFIANSLKPSFYEMELMIKEIETLFKRESYNKENIILIMNRIYCTADKSRILDDKHKTNIPF